MNLKEMILSKMPSDLSDIEKARYLYMELGKLLSFSTKFNNTDDKSHGLMRLEKVDITNFNGNQINCIMWSSLYSQLLNLVGIDNTIVKQGHDYVSFIIDGVRWCADATCNAYHDLARIHNSDNTAQFGIAQFQKKIKSNVIRRDEASLKMLEGIDEKLGYNTDDRKELLKFKDFLDDIRNGNFNIKDFMTSDINVSDEFLCKLEYLFARIGTLKHGYYESKEFTRELMEIMFGRFLSEHVRAYELKRTNRNKEVDIVQCITAYSNGKYYYYLLAPNLPIRKVTSEGVAQLALLGYGIGKSKIPGVIFPRKFRYGIVSTGIRYKLQRGMVSCDMKVYDIKQNSLKK